MPLAREGSQVDVSNATHLDIIERESANKMNASGLIVEISLTEISRFLVKSDA
jgi:hypothetical protein